MMRGNLVLVLTVTLVHGGHLGHHARTTTPAPSVMVEASVQLVPGSSSALSGNLNLRQEAGLVYITGTILGLTPGSQHGFHVHQNGALDDKCVAAGPHFNPFNNTHGAPNDVQRHVGDLGNLVGGSSGVTDVNVVDHLISLNAGRPNFIGGRAIVVHEKPDDLGLGGDSGSITTGNAGSRLGCGVINLLA